MNIRWKVTALIAALFTVLGVAQIFVARTVLMPSFAELEHSDAEIAMRRIDYALDTTLDRLAQSATAWGNWTGAYRFMQEPNRTFVEENFTPVGLKQLKANVLMFVEPNGRLAASATLDFDSDRPLELDFMRDHSLPADFPWRAPLDGAVTGLLQTNHGILMLAAAPILDGYGHGPALGMSLIGRLLSAAEIQRIGAQAQANLSMLSPRSPTARNQMAETDALTQVYRSHNDIYGRPIMSLRVDVPRDITRRGNLAVRYASFCLAAAAVIVLALLVWILDAVVLKPLARVTRHAVAIGEGRDLTTRLDAEGEDEIGVLAREFDCMVARVSEARNKLVDQSFQAGFAELAKGVLHNLGNAMTPIGVRLSGIRSRLRAAPLEDAEQAVAELRRGDSDPQRRADLEEFVLLACEANAATLKCMQADVEVMTRQTEIVQSVLAEQMGATRNEPVIESVRLTELIAQTLEVVPDAARQRLHLDADASLTAVGPVKIARTALRLVLQNFIINAADAVRETGKPQGSLRIAADIVRDPDGEQLHLVCTDDGIGIAAEHLTRIFDKGFTTKSMETNYGIGLHWCANAIAALGGRIWASSEGPGRGTSMHLLLPLEARNCLATARAA